MVTERLEPDIPGSAHPGTRPAAQSAEPEWLRRLGSVRAPLDLVPRTPHEILLCNNGQEEIRTAEILTPADFIGHHGKPPYQPGEATRS